MENELFEMAAGGVIAVWVLREVFTGIAGLLLKLKNGSSPPSEGNVKTLLQRAKIEHQLEENGELLKLLLDVIRPMASETNDLHQWHKTEDPETGVKVWYNQSTKIELKRQSEALLKLVEKLEKEEL